jgi:hypothetical protein
MTGRVKDLLGIAAGVCTGFVGRSVRKRSMKCIECRIHGLRRVSRPGSGTSAVECSPRGDCGLRCRHSRMPLLATG